MWTRSDGEVNRLAHLSGLLFPVPYSRFPVLFDHQIDDFGLADVQAGLRFEHLAHLDAVLLLVALRARDQTAGPREVLSRRNWMPTASATSPMMPPRASTSRTRWPLATPPMAGLQLICAMRSRFMVMSAVLRPMRAAAMAASQPA